nr:sterol regulatory element-binding protein cleavage-activating protein-like [Leptinotarsa decemlineata]
MDRTNILPQYSCLVLSPANLWNQDVLQFSQDSSLLTTIFSHHSFQKGKTSVSDMLFGMHLFDAGIKRYPIRNRQRIIQYAVTLFFTKYDYEFIEGLRKKLISLYPLHQNDSKNDNYIMNDTVLIQYPGEINYIELVPIIVSFVLVFLYYYFSVRKIELIKSKLGMALTATFTIFCSLTMTMGVCFFFGLTLNFESGKGIIPYLILLVGLENVLVLTKSVVATPLHLDVKIRNAQGLSKEGWSITKNLFLEITVLTFGLFTFVPAIQEFCIFSIVALITDYFLQLFFFLTILGLDMSRLVNSVENMNQNLRNGLYHQQNFFNKPTNMKGLNRSKSHPRLSSFPANIVAGQTQGVQEKKIPKRVRLVNIWARTRFFQRSFMILMIIWICVIAYNSDLINQYIVKAVIDDRGDDNATHNLENYSSIRVFPISTNRPIEVNYVTYNPIEVEYQQNGTVELEKLKHSEYAPWLKLSSRHWYAILKNYNVSLSGQTIAVLPNIKISHVVRPEQAVLLRNPDEKYGEKFQWQALAAALDPIDFRDAESAGTSAMPQSEQPFYPTSPMEILLTTILCIISILVLAYAFVVLYRCICSRNYAEWRASWFNEKSGDEFSQEDQVLLEAVPVILEGHQQAIECLVADSTSIISACLGGQLKVWDNNTGELIANIDRKSFFSDNKPPDLASELDDRISDYDSSSPPKDETLTFPRLLNKINTDFSHHIGDSPAYTDSKYDFNKSYRYFYFNHNFDVRLRHKYDCVKDDMAKRTSIEENIHKKRRSIDDNDESEVSFKSEYSQSGWKRDVNNSSVNGRASINNDQSNFSCCKLSPVWCMDYQDNLIVIGCADGRLEFWEGTTAKLKCIFEDGTESSISHVKIIGARVIAVRLCGMIELLQLQTYNQGRPIDWNFTCAYRRMHVRTASAGSITDHDLPIQTDSEEDLRCIKLQTIKAHQQPITCLDCEGSKILTGSQDHTLKVFRLDDGSPLYTLHGHCGPITCLFIDRINPATSGSGSQDGMLCVWDLLTGACMYSIQAHNGSITSLTYSASYVISLGTDDRLCVWERFQGHLLNTINISQPFSNQVLMLAQHLVITARSGGLVIWDVRTGDCVRTITLGRAPFIFINQLILLRDAVLCDYGKQLRIVRFPLITHKFD